MKIRSVLFCGAWLMLLAALPARPQSSVARAAEPQPGPVTLDELVAVALRSNPEIQAAAHRLAAARARVPQAESLPDPTITFGWMGKPVPFVVDSTAPTSNRSVSATEDFPYPGKRKLRGRVADRQSQAAWWDYEAARRQIVLEVKVAYFQFAYFHQALRIIQDNRTLLQQLIKVAEARYESGEGVQQDVLRGQVELSELLERTTVLNEQAQSAVARLNTLLVRDPDSSLGPPEPLRQAALGYTLDQLYQLARSNDTGLQRDLSLVERDRDALALSRKSYDPDFSVSYVYQRMAVGMNMNGAALTLNLPVFYKSKQRQAVSEASENLAADRDARANRQANLDYLVKEQFLAANQAEKLATLYSQAILPQSSQTLQSSQLAYESGASDFLTILSNFINVLDFQVNYCRQISDYQVALARLEPLVGVELTR